MYFFAAIIWFLVAVTIFTDLKEKKRIAQEDLQRRLATLSVTGEWK